jgi:hypothetical protein
MISHKQLGLPSELADQFRAWIDRYWTRTQSTIFDIDAFNTRGRDLAKELKCYVGAETEVVFEPEAEDGGLKAPEIIMN